MYISYIIVYYTYVLIGKGRREASEIGRERRARDGREGREVNCICISVR